MDVNPDLFLYFPIATIIFLIIIGIYVMLTDGGMRNIFKKVCQVLGFIALFIILSIYLHVFQDQWDKLAIMGVLLVSWAIFAGLYFEDKDDNKK